MHEVAITGIGIVSCLGTGADKVTASLREGRSGIGVDPEREAHGFRSPLTGLISDFEPPKLGRKERRTLTEFGMHAYAAALQAIQSAGWQKNEVRSSRTGLIIGNDSSALSNVEQVDVVRNEGRTLDIGSGAVFKSLNSTVTMNLNTLLGTRGAAWTISGACASGGHAIGQAADLIALGRQERILAGGAQEINWQSLASFDATNAFSIRTDVPAGASRPFDAGRDGLVPSGGAAIVALENMEEAKRRGADILGRVVAYAFSSDGDKLAVPSGDGLLRCMRECLALGSTLPANVNYITAHATSTPVGDAVEAESIARIFGEATGRPGDSELPWVSSTKSMTGHEMWMAGAAQVVYACLMARGGFIAPNINFSAQETDAPRLRIANETIDKKPGLILCNSAGFGGTNSCLLIDTNV